MNPSQLADAVLAAAAAALASLGRDSSLLPATTSVERPRHPGHGDYASALALQVAKQAGLPPRELAQQITDRLGDAPRSRMARYDALNGGTVGGSRGEGSLWNLIGWH